MQPSINDIRKQLRQNASQVETNGGQNYVARNKTYVYSDPPGITRETSTFQRISDYRPPEKIGKLLNNFHWIAAIFMAFLTLYFLKAPEGMRLPGSGTIDETSLGNSVFVCFVTGVFTFFFMKKFRDGANNLHTIRNIGKSTRAFQIGAALGASYFLYNYFMYSGLMSESQTFNDKLKGLASLELLKLAAFTIIGGKAVQYISNKWFGEDEVETSGFTD